MAGPCPAVTPHHVPCLSFPISPAEIPLLLCCEGRRRATCQAAWQHLAGGGVWKRRWHHRGLSWDLVISVLSGAGAWVPRMSPEDSKGASHPVAGGEAASQAPWER